MKTIEITAAAREHTGKAANKKVRREKRVPATVYGQSEPVNISVDYQEIKKALHTPLTYIVNLGLDGNSTQTVIREAQYHPVTDAILHVDFMRIDDENEVEIKLPVKLVGSSVGVRSGGRLVPLSRRVKVKGVIKDLPEFVEVDVTALELGSTITIAGAKIEGLNITSPASTGLAMVDVPRAVKQAQQEAASGAATAAPEE